MLVLTRLPQEGIVIILEDGREIVVQNCGFYKGRIGITAPPTVQVHRREIQERIKAKGAIRADFALPKPGAVTDG